MANFKMSSSVSFKQVAIQSLAEGSVNFVVIYLCGSKASSFSLSCRKLCALTCFEMEIRVYS